MTVTLLLNRHEKPVGVYESEGEARVVAKRFNEDPYIEGVPDPDVPYSVEVWVVKGTP